MSDLLEKIDANDVVLQYLPVAKEAIQQGEPTETLEAQMRLVADKTALATVGDHKDRARALTEQGWHEDAVKVLTMAIEEDPNNIELYELRAASYGELGKNTPRIMLSAHRDINSIYKIRPDRESTLMMRASFRNLGDALDKKADQEELDPQEYLEDPRFDPTFFRMEAARYYGLAITWTNELADLDDDAEVMSLLEGKIAALQSTAESTQDPYDLFVLALFQNAIDKGSEDAIDTFTQAKDALTNAGKTDIRFPYQLAIAHHESDEGDTMDAIENFLQVLEDAEEGYDGNEVGKSMLFAGKCYKSLRMQSRAREMFEDLLKTYPNDEDDDPRKKWFTRNALLELSLLLTEGEVEQQDGDWKLALSYADQANELMGDQFAQFTYALLIARVRRGHPEIQNTARHLFALCERNIENGVQVIESHDWMDIANQYL